MKISAIETAFDSYTLQFKFAHHLKGDKITVYIEAFNNNTGGFSSICNVNGMDSQFPEYVRVNDMDNSWIIPAKEEAHFVAWIARIDKSEIFKCLAKDEAEGEWSQ